MDSIDGIPEDAPQIRLCHIKKRSDFNGYGFNLHAEKSKPGQFIGTVDEGSPAERGGLKEGDRIVEVNDCNICHENHKQVVARIKAIPDETRLLVVDKETEDYYRNKEIVVRRDLPTVVFISSDDDDDYNQPPPNNNNYNTSESNIERRNKKKLGNVCHQSFAVEDEEDGADDINYAMQQPSPNPPPLPNSAPPISDEDEDDRIQPGSNDRNSLGGSSYDKGDKRLDTDMESFPPPPNEEDLVGEEEEAPGTKIVVRATIESSSESGDDQHEEGIESHRNSIPSIQAVEEIGSSLNQENDRDSLNENVNGVIHNDKKDGHSDSHSNSSETTPDQLEEHINQIVSMNGGENVDEKNDEDTHSTKSISSGAMHNTEVDEATDVNSEEASEWNNKMANMPNSVGSRSISNASFKNENYVDKCAEKWKSEAIEENKTSIFTPAGPLEMRVTKDTIVSKENVKIEVTRQRKKTLPNSDEYVDESVVVNPPMPAPRTVTPVSEKSSTASMEESSPRSFSPTSFEHSVSLPPNTNNNDVVDANGSRNRSKNWDGLNLNMTAAEMRERIGSKKKRDPRKEDRMDFRTKYDMIQAL